MRKGIIILILLAIVLFVIALQEAYSAAGDPTQFGNETDTTCWIGGTAGILNCTKLYGDGSLLSGLLNHTSTVFTLWGSWFYNQTLGAMNYFDEILQNNESAWLSTYNSTYDAQEDTNETARFDYLTKDDCPGDYLVIGVEDNGSVKCAIDTGEAAGAEGKSGDPPFLYNDSDTMYWNWTSINDTEWIWPGVVLDIDKEDIESDLNTFVDIAGDTMTGTLEVLGLNISTAQNCDTLDTDAYGNVSCGTDADTSYNATYDEWAYNQSRDEFFYNQTTPAETYADTQDALQDECSEITGCVENAVPSADLNKTYTVNESLDQYIDKPASFGGEVSGTYDNIVLGHNALDDQYYDSEGDLTGLLDDNYVDIAGDIMTGALGILKYLNITGYAADATTAGLLILAKDRGSFGSSTEINVGDILGEILFKGYSGDSSSQETGARIYCKATATPGQANDMPCNLTFAVSPDNSQTPVDRMFIRPDGNISIPNSLLASAFYGNFFGNIAYTYITGHSWVTVTDINNMIVDYYNKTEAGAQFLDETDYAAQMGDNANMSDVDLKLAIADYEAQIVDYLNLSGGSMTGDLIIERGLIPDTVGGAWLGNSTNELGAIYSSTNDKHYFGDGQEGEIYYNGSSLIIKIT